MNLPHSPRSGSALLLSLIAAAGLSATSLFTQSVTTTPVGAVSVPALANSETFLAMPLSRAPVFTGVVSSVSGSTLNVAGTPGWTANQFVKSLPSQSNTYYVRLRTGALAGQYFTVASNGSNSLTVDNGGLDLSIIAASDKIEVTPYWSLGTLLPASAAGTAFTASASAFTRQTEIYFPNLNHNGVNPPTDETFYFLNGAWRKVGAAATVSFDDRVILPDVFVKLRNRAAASTVTVVGQVESGAVGSVINRGTVKIDNVVSISFPADVSLANSGLISSGAFQASASAFSRSDELLVFSDSAAGVNRPATATYYYLNSAWRKVGSPATTDFSNDQVFKAAKGVVIRKAAGVATSQLWTYTASIP